VQLELMPQPPDSRDPSTPWPLWPMQLRTSHAHEEGGVRDWSIATTALTGSDGRVQMLHAVRVAPGLGTDGRPRFEPIAGSELTIDADLVLLAMGFEGPSREGPHAQLGVALDARGCVLTDAQHLTSVAGVFAAGDAHRGASLIVWAIREGRDAAHAIDAYLRSGDRRAHGRERASAREGSAVASPG